MVKNKWVVKGLLLLVIVAISACSPKPRTEKEILIGTISGPETDLVKVASKIAAEKYGIDLKIIEFEDYVLPNTSLAEGAIDANMFQHQAYLDATVEAHNYPIVTIGKTFIYPMGLYSNKVRNLKDLVQNAKVAIPNDPSNMARALRLLQQAGLIILNNSGSNISLRNVSLNSKNLKFIELDAAQLPRALNDIDLAAINTNYALPAGLSLTKDALVVESKDSPYANVIVVRKNDVGQDKFIKLVKALNSDEVKAKAQEIFGESAIAAWED